ncbi:hypothetical protein JN09_001041 [Acholeplasma morum]|nr:hypothetical protein [Paracholeplasma morum]
MNQIKKGKVIEMILIKVVCVLNAAEKRRLISKIGEIAVSRNKLSSSCIKNDMYKNGLTYLKKRWHLSTRSIRNSISFPRVLGNNYRIDKKDHIWFFQRLVDFSLSLRDENMDLILRDYIKEGIIYNVYRCEYHSVSIEHSGLKQYVENTPIPQRTKDRYQVIYSLLSRMNVLNNAFRGRLNHESIKESLQ